MESDPRLRPPMTNPTRTLRRSGGSCVLTIPPEILADLGWQERDDVSLLIQEIEGTRRLVLTEATDEE